MVSILSIGAFEYIRLSTHLLASPCTILKTEMIDVGTCTLCDSASPQTCQVHAIAAARVMVNFHHTHVKENVTGSVWFCKDSLSEDPCDMQMRLYDQSLYMNGYTDEFPRFNTNPVPCTVGEVLRHVEAHERSKHKAQEPTCYYSSTDTRGEDVWFSAPSPGMIGHSWFEQHLEYPVLVALGSLVLLALLLGCLAVQGAELYFSGLV